MAGRLFAFGMCVLISTKSRDRRRLRELIGVETKGREREMELSECRAGTPLYDLSRT